jgi:hypothetical protein
VPNPSVYYEIGLADALGKPVFLFKQANVPLPADFSGIHYYEYDASSESYRNEFSGVTSGTARVALFAFSFAKKGPVIPVPAGLQIR